jgi:hypothetical protein
MIFAYIDGGNIKWRKQGRRKEIVECRRKE